MARSVQVADSSPAHPDAMEARGGPADELTLESAVESSNIKPMPERILAMLDQCAAGILAFDTLGICLYASAPAVSLLGAAGADALVGVGAPPELRADIADSIARCEERHRPRCELARKDGAGPSWVEYWVRPTAGGVVVTLVDVSMRRQADAEAAFRKILLTAQSDTSLDGILVVSPESELISYNRRFVEMWAVPRHIVESRSDHEALEMVLGKVVDPQGFIAKVKHLYTHPDEESRDEIELRDGRTFDRYSAPVRDPAGTHFGRVWFFRDVTERQRAEREREEALRRAERACAAAEAASRAKDEFLAVVSHELRTPLTAVLGWARLLRTHMRSEAERDRALAIIERNALMQVKLIEDLLDVSRVITGKIRLNVGPVELSAIIATAVDSLQPAAAAKGLQLTTALEETAAFITGDPERLQQVIFNLLSNAIKFTPEGGHVSICLDRRGSLTEIVVHDDGIGIDAGFLPRVFERFQQADALPTTRNHGGLGLGLAIVRHLVELHGGSVSAESEGQGRGSRFIVRLPVRALAAASEPIFPPSARITSAHSSELGMPDLEGVRVLFVDDEADARGLLAELLGGCGAHVLTADSVEAAIAMYSSRAFDVVVSDISMPGKDGYDLVTRLRETEAERGLPRIPTVALTALASESSRARAAEAGFDAYLTKPAEAMHLTRTVARAVNRSG